MSEVKWIKITTNIFNDDKILLIESMPESDSIIVIWFKLLALAGRNNNSGIVMMNDQTPYTEDMLVTLFRRKKTIITLALHTFVQFNMIEILDNNTILINNWEKHQNIDGLELIREKGRLRVQKYRDKQKLLLDNKDKKQKKEIDKEEEIDKESNISVTLHRIINYLNEKTDSNYRYSTKSIQDKIKARLNEKYIYEDFIKVIDIKYNEWNNTEFAKFLRPSTLFGTKFSEYLNQKDNIKEESIYDYLPKKE